MSVEFGGDTFVPLSAEENALALLTSINSLLIANSVMDSDGNQAQIYVNAASPIWLILFAIGQAITVFQYLVIAAGNSLSITDCSDQQVLNLAQIAGTERIAGTPTTLFVSVTAGAAGASVTPSNLLLYTDTVFFVPLTTTPIPANSTVIIETRSSVVGAYIILPGEINSFVTTPVGVTTVSNALASIPGVNIESISSLRRRIQKGSGLQSSIDSAIAAIRNLSGITHCNIFFNPSLVSNLTIPGGYTLLPRQAMIFVYGSSLVLAETYLKHMLSETAGVQTQTYTTLGGQAFIVRYNLAVLRYYYVKVVVKTGSGQDGYLTEIINRLLPASGVLNIGEQYSQQFLINYLDNFTYANILGLYVSMDNAIWTDITEVDGDEIGVLSSTYITAVEK